MRSQFYRSLSMILVLALADQMVHPILHAKAQSVANAVPPIQSSTRFCHGDHLGSTRVVTDNSGVEQERYSYYPYGELFHEIRDTKYASRFLYTGQLHDPETNLDYFGSRYYDGKLGRFISIDPYVGLTEQPYAYANNNPIYYIDVNGDYAMVAALPFLPGFGPVGIAIGVGILAGYGGYVAYEYLKTPPSESTNMKSEIPASKPTEPVEVGTKTEIQDLNIPSTYLSSEDRGKAIGEYLFLMVGTSRGQLEYVRNNAPRVQLEVSRILNGARDSEFQIKEHVEPSDFWDLATPSPFSDSERIVKRAMGEEVSVASVAKGIIKIQQEVGRSRYLAQEAARKEGKLNDPYVNGELARMSQQIKALEAMRIRWIQGYKNAGMMEED